MTPAPDSPQALYQAIPQEPEDNASEIDLNADNESLPIAPHDIPQELIDVRIKWICFILGSAVLLPWNVIITAMPFFLSRLKDSSLKSTIGSYMTASFTGSNLVFLAHATMTSKYTSPSRRTRLAIICLALLTFLLTLSTYVIPAPGLFAGFILLNGVCQAAAGSYLQTSTVAVASLFGPSAIQSMMSGQAAVAVAVSGVQVITSAMSLAHKPRNYVSDGSAEERSAFIFFLLSTFFLVVTYLAHEWLVRIPLYEHVAGPLEQQAHKRSISQGTRRRSISIPREEVVEGTSNLMRVAKINVRYELAVGLVFLITLSVFPPITISVAPLNPDIHPLLFSAIHFLVFNCGDFLGRYACSFPSMLIWSSSKLLMLSSVRALFIPLFLLCNVQRPLTGIPAAPFINSDYIFLFLMLLFGWSNGYLCSLNMMAAPSIEHNPGLRGRVADVDVAATAANFSLVIGLVLGSLFSFAVRSAICNCNPFTM